MNYILDLYRFMRGFVTINIKGGFPERFLNLCNKENIYLWDTAYCEGNITAKIYCKDFSKLKKIRIKSGVSIKIIDKHGLVIFFRRNQKRKFLVYGLTFSLLFMSLMNLFVWCIEVKNTYNISKEEVFSVVNRLGLDFGTFVPLFDEAEAGREAVNIFNGKAIWTAINIKGSKATVEIREYAGMKDEHKSDTPCNIIADFDGVILSTEVYSGVSSIFSGSAVKKGDLLISGISENVDGSVNFHAADGKVTALHNRQLNYNCDKTLTKQTLSKINDSTQLNIFSLKLPLSFNAFVSADEKVRYTKRLKIGESLLPFGVTNSCVIKISNSEIKEKNLICCIDEFTQKEYEIFKNTLIINSEYSFSGTEGGYNINSDYDCIDFIGKKSEILQEN